MKSIVDKTIFYPSNRFYTFERVEEIVGFIQKLVTIKPEIAIICGSGLSGLAELVTDKIIIPYADIPHFPRSTGESEIKATELGMQSLLR